MSKRDKDKPPDVHIEDGRWLRPGNKIGRAGRGPKNALSGKNPRGYGRSPFKAGPTRGTASTGHDRKGKGFFSKGGK